MFTAAPSSTVTFLLLQGHAHGLTAELCSGDPGLAIPCATCSPCQCSSFGFHGPFSLQDPRISAKLLVPFKTAVYSVAMATEFRCVQTPDSADSVRERGISFSFSLKLFETFIPSASPRLCTGFYDFSSKCI